MTRPTITISAFEIARARRAIDERCTELRNMGYAVRVVETVGPIAIIELRGDEATLITLDPLELSKRLGVRRDASNATR
jgi:hypothetical protein